MICRTFEDLGAAWGAITEPQHAPRLQAHADRHRDRGAGEHGVRDRLRAADRPRERPREGPPQRVRRPAARAVAGRRRPLARHAVRHGRLVPLAPATTASRFSSRGPRSCSRRSSSRSRSSRARWCRRFARSATEQEQAAHTLGASGWQTFWRVTLPSIRWAVIYGVVLTTARCLGEFGAVAIVSGNIDGKTQTATLRVEDAYQFAYGNYAPAYGISLVLAVMAIIVLFTMMLVEAEERKRPDVDLRPEHLQAVRRLRRARRRVARGADRLADRAARAERQRQVHAAPHHRRARARPTPARSSSPTRTSRRRRPRSAGIGFVFQHYAAFKHMTVYDNIAFGLTIRERPKAEIRERVAQLLEARAARRTRQALPVAALRRPAPADGAGPRARGRPEGAAARRALRGARRTRPHGAAGLAPAPPRRDAHDHRDRHTRPGGGDGGGRRRSR